MYQTHQDPFELQVLADLADLDKEKAELHAVLKRYREFKRKNPNAVNSNGAASLIPSPISVPTTIQYKKKGIPRVPDSYDQHRLTWDEKCLYALKQLGPSFADDVVNKISELEPSTPKKPTIKNAVTNKLSKMALAGWINGKAGAKGRSTEYSLK